MIFFVHVGKTGGTTIKREIRAALGVPKRREPQVVADKVVLLNHMRLTEAVERFGEPEGIVLAFRDPTRRFLSGFYCRQRMGWPDHNVMWDAREAAAFAHFDSANDLAEALGMEDPARRAAAVFAMDAIRHLRRGYVFHLGRLTPFLLDHGERVLGCIETEQIARDLPALLGRMGLVQAEAGEEMPAGPRPDYPADLSPLAQDNLRTFWAEEYAYYEAFRAYRDNLL